MFMIVIFGKHVEAIQCVEDRGMERAWTNTDCVQVCIGSQEDAI